MHTPLRLLLVDDNTTMRRVIHLFLDSTEFEIIGEVGDGSLAVEWARRLMPDIVLMDYQMPVMDGLTAARLMLAGPEPPTIIMLSGSIDPDIATSAQQLGIHAILHKGVTLEQIRDTLLNARRNTATRVGLAA